MKKLAIGCSFLLLCAAVMGMWVAHILAKPAQKSDETEKVTRGDVVVKVIEDGTIEPLSKVDVKSKVAGRILRLYVHEGQTVHQGQILATIDPIDVINQVKALEAQLDAAEARLASARKAALLQDQQTSATIAQYQQNLAQAKARLDEAELQATAQPQLNIQAIQNAKAALEAAKANLKAQQQALELMVKTTHPNAVASARSAYQQALAQEQNAALNLQRQKQLLQKGFVSQSAVDAADETYLVAKAQEQEAKEKLDRIEEANAIEEQSARSQVAAAQAQVAQAEAALRQAQLNPQPIASQDELASAKAAYQQALAQLAQARSNLIQNKMRRDDVLAAAADAQQIRNQLNAALVQLHDTTIYSPMTGVITKRYVEPGDLITSAISSFTSGSPIYQVADLGTMLVKIEVNEVDINKIRVGMPTQVTTSASPGVVFWGRVSKVAPAASSYTAAAASNGTATPQNTVIRFPVEIRIDHADPRLRPGMSAHCTIIVAARHNVLRVPVDCLYGTGSHPQVKVVLVPASADHPKPVTQMRTIQIGIQDDNYAEVLSGLKEGEVLMPAPYTGPPRQKFDIHEE
ncbi:multidrug resistance efflux pump [Chthonomonas calidirosea]|uniref:Multidrug resistance efflux pump n=1 Tax=Chthonomonas calidirosea (strain DSM 23976 / ICMP 18418 / T49) TaxID=1303518 RepID=S0EV88_CHTCT|nr:efflux RND transporter periplasmic adaptor subunit [Chthonomonas calidirosea]CCW35323.1 Multidrug resistance efflux pump [Chthonomonas calidirosea T49]CEK20607.1 multidrug resistance efflux pump [Chthonomonas calidirosea]